MARTLPVLVAGMCCVSAGMGARAAEPGGGAHGMPRVSTGAYRARLAELGALAGACEQRAADCDEAKVGDDLRVQASPEFEVRWDWMRGALKQARGANDFGRQQAMAGVRVRLDEASAELAAGSGGDTSPPFATARKVTDQVLAAPEFSAVERQSWLDRMMARISRWWARLWEGVHIAGVGGRWLGRLLEILLFGGAAVGLALVLWRNLQRQRVAIALHDDSASLAWTREAQDWAAEADASAREGRWRDAVHCLYWAAIVLLESRRAWRHNPARTPREYVRLLERGSAQQQALGGLTGMLERLWYGLRDAEERDYERARSLFESLRDRNSAGAA